MSSETVSNVVLPEMSSAVVKQGASVSKPWLWYLLAVCLIALDQWTKTLASDGLRYAEPLVLTSFFNLTLLHNPGAAFSFLGDAGGWQHWLFGGVALIVSSVITVWLYRAPVGAILLKFALALILAGALGNLWDRMTLGYVVDFIQLHYKTYYWPAFNVADAAISVGACAMIFDSFWSAKRN